MRRYRINLKTQMIINTLMLVLFLIALLAYEVRSFSLVNSHTFKQNQEIFSSQLVTNTERNYSNIRNITYSLSYNTVLQDYLQETVPQEKYDLYKQLNSMLSNTRNLNTNILDFAVVGNDGSITNINGDKSIYTPLFNEILQSSQSAIYFFGNQYNITTTGITLCQVIAMPIYDYNDPGNIMLGYLFVAINPNSILNGEEMVSLSMPVNLLLQMNDGTVVWGDDTIVPDIQTLESGDSALLPSADGKTTYDCFAYEIPSADSKLYVFINQQDVTQLVSRAVFSQSLIGIILIVAASMFMLMYYQSFSHYFKQLNKIMRRVSKGGEKGQNERITFDDNQIICREFEVLAQSFNTMMDETAALNRRILEHHTREFQLEMSNKQMEISFLQSQINPHFLNNTMTLICGMASAGEQEGVINIANSLSAIFRYNTKGGKFATVRDELQIAKSYIQIQQTRFAERFTVRYYIDDKCLDLMIPKMLLQPLVENAIIHGLEPKLEAGKLIVDIHQEKDGRCISLTVLDTGVGISANQLRDMKAELLEQLTGSEDEQANARINAHHIGLANVFHRLYLYYGIAGIPDFQSKEGEFTKVTITIPLYSQQGAVHDVSSNHH